MKEIFKDRIIIRSDSDTLNSINVYAKLLSKAIDFAETREREITNREANYHAIRAQYQIQADAIAGEIQKFEAVITADSERRKRFVESSTDAINILIEKEQYEIANLFHERLANSFEGNPLQALIDYREKYASAGYIGIKLT